MKNDYIRMGHGQAQDQRYRTVERCIKRSSFVRVYTELCDELT